MDGGVLPLDVLCQRCPRLEELALNAPDPRQLQELRALTSLQRLWVHAPGDDAVFFALCDLEGPTRELAENHLHHEIRGPRADLRVVTRLAAGAGWESLWSLGPHLEAARRRRVALGPAVTWTLDPALERLVPAFWTG